MPPRRRSLSVSTDFVRELMNIPKAAQRSALREMEQLRDDATRPGSKPLAGNKDIWVCRVWPYRLFYAFKGGWIHFISIRNRQGAYESIPDAPDLPTIVDEVFDSEVLSSELPEDNYLSVLRNFDVNELRSQGVAPDAIDALMSWDGTENGFFRLTDYRLPEWIMELILADLVAERPATSEAASVELVRRHILDRFFRVVEGLPSDSEVEEVTIVSPWITPWVGENSSLAGLARVVARRRLRVRVITRPPISPASEKALNLLSTASTKSVDVFYVNNLHAKFYVCDLAPVPFALITSANATQGSLSNVELGLFVRGRGEFEAVIRDLQGLADQLAAESGRL